MVTTSHFKIFDFWKDKYITMSGEIIEHHTEHSEPVVVDWGEPSCWCCGIPIVLNNEEELQKYNDFRSIWNHNKVKEKLNRCHIVPDSLGGEDEPCNLFLLCSECHDKAPDTDEPKHFIRYIYNTRHNRFFGVNAQEIRQMLISSIMLRFPNADEKDMESLFNKLLLKFNKDNFEEYCLKHSTLHWSDTGPHYAISTAVEMFIDFLLTYERDVCELVINKKSIKQK